MGRENRRVLIVDDQDNIHKDFKEILDSNVEESASDSLAKAFLKEEFATPVRTFQLLHAHSGEEACKIVRSAREDGRPIALGYVDVRMPPGIDGVETVRRIRKIDRDIEIVIMTAYTDMPLSRLLHDMGLLHKLLYVRKPFSREMIAQMTLSLVNKWNVEQDLARRREHLTISHQRLESVLNATGDAIAMYEENERLVFANKRYEKLLGVEMSELERTPPDAVEARFRKWPHTPTPQDSGHRFLFGGTGEIVEPVSPAHDGVFYRSKRPVHDGAGRVIGDVVAYRDVSTEVEMEQMKVEVVRLRSELTTTYAFDNLLGTSPAMQDIFALIEQASGSDIAVLISGESGTGKELIAKSLHYNGLRKQGPFVAINCAAIPEGLIESELFGHEKGAFTGAVRRRTGAFERADGGTILLDEIAELQPVLQTKLLRVLQEREIQRLGATTPRAVDVRVLAATNRNPQEAIREGSLREDLYYRLAAFPIAVPPLRERREDIPLLAEHFLNQSNTDAGKSIRGFSAGALRVLLQYDWPGNVRELRNTIERAVVLETGAVLQVGNLPAEIARPPAQWHEGASDKVAPLVEIERRAIGQALKACEGNVAAAARALGLNRATLYRKLKKYGLNAADYSASAG